MGFSLHQAACRHELSFNSKMGRIGTRFRVKSDPAHTAEFQRMVWKGHGLDWDLVRAGKGISKKQLERRKDDRGKSKKLDFEEKLDTGVLSTGRGKDAIGMDHKNKQFTKGFAALAELVSQQDRNSALFSEGRKLESIVRVHNQSGRAKANSFLETMFTTTDEKENNQSQAPASLWNDSPATATSSGRGSKKTEDALIVDGTERPSLRGQEILLAMQKAAIEKAKLKQKNQKASHRVEKAKENELSQATVDWRNARPLIIRPEWNLRIEDLERRIKDLKNQIQI